MNAENKKKYRLYDALSVARDPFMMLFFIIPLIAAVALKIMVALASKLLMQYLAFDLSPYYAYIQAMVVMLSPMMLGTGTAFMMLDEMDAGLLPLMRIIPGSLTGYLTRRLIMPVFISAVYIPVCYLITMFYSLTIVHLTLLTLLGAMQAVFFTAFIFSISKDKVAGIAVSKASGLLFLPCFAPMLADKWTVFISSLTPLYYVSKLSMPYTGFTTILAGFVVNIIWLLVFNYLMVKRIKNNN